MPRWLTRDIIKSGSDNYNNYNKDTGLKQTATKKFFTKSKDFYKVIKQ